MFKTILTGWFIIQSYSGFEDQKHKYLVTKPQNNYQISIQTEQELPYGENTWIKLKIYAEQCKMIYQPVRSMYCSSTKVEHLKCTRYNSFIVGGVPYC